MPKFSLSAVRTGLRAALVRHGAKLLLCVVLAMALWLRVDLGLGLIFPSVDGVHYLHTARDLVRDGVLSFSTFPPGWPLLVSAGLRTHGSLHPADLLLTAQALNVLLGTAAGLLVFVLIRRHTSAWWALLATSVFLFVPATVSASTGDLSEMSYVIVLLAAWLVFERRPSWWAGALFGFAYLVRPEALLVFVALLVYRFVVEHRVAWTALAGCAVFVIPYVLFMHDATGSWSLSSKHAFLEAALEDRGVRELIGQWLRNAWSLLPPLVGLIGWPLTLLSLWGVVLHRGRWLLAYLPMLLLPVFTFRMEGRYWIAVLPFILLYAMFGARALIARWPQLRAASATVLVLMVLGGAVYAVREDWKLLGANFEYYPGMLAAGQWLGAHAGPDESVVDYKPYVAFWADLDFRKLPHGRDLDGIVDWARESGAHYLAVNVHLAGSLTPELRPLLGEVPAPLAPKLTLVHAARIEGDPRQTTLLYRVEPVGGGAVR